MSEINLTISRLSTCLEEIQYTVEGGGWLSRWQSTIVTWWYVPSIKKDAKILCNKHMLPKFEDVFTTELLSMAIFWFDNDSSEHCGRSEIEWNLWWTRGVEIHHNHKIVISQTDIPHWPPQLTNCINSHFMLRTISLLFVLPCRFSARQVYGPLFFWPTPCSQDITMIMKM